MDVHLRCPSPPELFDHGEGLTRRLTASQLPDRLPRLERLLAADFLSRRPNGNATPFERFLERPAVELVLAQRWNALKRPMDAAMAASLVADLTGAPAMQRGIIAASTFDRAGVRSVYADAEHARGWSDRVAAAEPMIDNPFVRACHAYAEAALSHPFADGNGRLARAMFTRALARAGCLTGPILHLGPLIYRHHRRVIEALVTLGTTGDWRPFLTLMEALASDVLTFAEHVLAEPRGARHVGGA